MLWFWLGVLVLLSLPMVLVTLIVYLHGHVCSHYLQFILRIVQEKPLFTIPRGDPIPDAEDVLIPTPDGLRLKGVYFRTTQPRRGVILFGLEFGSNRWSCLPYCEELLRTGYDVFTFEPRNQGDSERVSGYEPLQWVTRYEELDTAAAIDYLKARTDADPRGIGYFGISKGGSIGLLFASQDRYIRCIATDGAFSTVTTMIPYMRKWMTLYSTKNILQLLLPRWFLASIAHVGLSRLERERRVEFVHLEEPMDRLRCPLLMIHGGLDTYIKPAMARDMFGRAKGPGEFWLVDKARHNQALHLARDEYHRRVTSFFDRWLGFPNKPQG